MTTRGLALAMLVVACSSTHGGTVDGNGGGGGGDGGGGGGGDANRGGDAGSNGSGGAQATIFTIVLENHDYAEIVGNTTDAPYINSLIGSGGLATNYKDTGHPSLPNYLHMISGSNQYPGGVDLDPTTPPFPVTEDNLGTQLEAAGIPWRSYQESAGTTCKLSSSGNYAPKHDPFLYFDDQQTGSNGLCADTNVDFSKFAADLATSTYQYMWITPNLLDDGHDPSSDPVAGLQQSDAWLKSQLPTILASAGYTAGGIIFITWDEAEGRNGDDPDKIPMIMLSPKLKQAGMTSSSAYNHSSYLATVEDLFGLPRLGTVKNAPAMTEFFSP